MVIFNIKLNLVVSNVNQHNYDMSAYRSNGFPRKDKGSVHKIFTGHIAQLRRS